MKNKMIWPAFINFLFQHNRRSSSLSKAVLFSRNLIFGSMLLTLAFGLTSSGLKSAPTETKKVFAHYMVAIPTYNQGVNGYKKEIQEAQAAGIDGFALNAGSWSVETRYKTHVAEMFQAAQELNSGFKLFFSADMCCTLKSADISEMVRTYANHPNYFKYQNKPLLSTFAGEGYGRDWWSNNVLNPLSRAGYSVYFVPHFYTNPVSETPDWKTVSSSYSAWWKDIINGHFYFGAAGLPQYKSPSLLSAGEAHAKVMHDNQKAYMATVSPQYWGDKQYGIGRRYYEFGGGEGLAAQWNSIVNTQKPEWVELVTWNDFNEATYFSPAKDVDSTFPYLGHQPGFHNEHGGALQLNKYFIDWYKTGQQPTIARDRLFFFYRTHPKDASSTDPKGAVTWRFGDVQDVIYVTTMLTAPAELRVITGGVTKFYNVGRGMVHTRVPFNVGKQKFELWRNGVKITEQSGEDIVSNFSEYNFNYYTGYTP